MACPSAVLSYSPGSRFDKAIFQELESEGFLQVVIWRCANAKEPS